MSTLGEAKAKEKQQTARQLLIRSLVQQNVKYIFGIPGGKIMPTFDVLRDEGPSPRDRARVISSPARPQPPLKVIPWSP
jgi:hypothetical protein